jgi:hypothetical protein
VSRIDYFGLGDPAERFQIFAALFGHLEALLNLATLGYSARRADNCASGCLYALLVLTLLLTRQG